MEAHTHSEPRGTPTIKVEVLLAGGATGQNGPGHDDA